MADRLQSNLGLIRNLIERAPDKAVRDLESALSGGLSAPALDDVRSMVDREVADRKTRDIVLDPIRRVFGSRPDGIAQLAFPKVSYGNLWRAMKKAFPEPAAAAAAAALRRPEVGAFPEVYDILCEAAAAAMRAREIEDFTVLAVQLDGTLADGAEQLARCLELTRIMRPALAKMPEWLQRMTEDRAATVRLAYKDAVAIQSDSGPRLFELFGAHLAEPWMILRLISAVMVRPVDNYVSSSELAVFGERLMADIDRRLDMIRAFDLDGGEAGGEIMGLHIRAAGAQIDEFETALNLRREGPWGARLTTQKAALAKGVETHLRKADEVIAAALPLAPVRVGGRIVRQAPKLDAPPDERLLRRARAMITLVAQVRSAAVNGGYNSLRIKVAEEIDQRLDGYIEGLLDALHNGEPDEVEMARLYLDRAAALMGQVRDEKAAAIVRRRAAAA